jgi:flagellar protein FlaG|tara:strand:- start:181 stop:570 length:390 start_codon:yes stop_codon:yes gene_type:complete
MVNEATVASVHVSPQIVGKNADKQLPLVKVESLQNQKPKPVPEAPNIDIDRQPIISATELEAKIVELNEAMASRNQAVLFSTDAATGKDVVRVSNKNTGELIRQMPSVEALKAMQNIDQMMGLIFNQKT